VKWIREGVKRLVKPFLKWVGGKSSFVEEIVAEIPKLSGDATYYEPFLGAASVFLALQPKRAALSDLNEHLIRTFQAVRDSPELVARYLGEFSGKYGADFYYEIRKQFNKDRFSILQAARFIYLNKAGFNGVYRVNEQGKYNVPHGRRRNVALPEHKDLVAVSEALSGAALVASDYVTAVRNARKGDFVYLDPPYPPLSESAYFTHYTKERFSDLDQERVAMTASMLSSRGVRAMVTNADTSRIRKLFRGWRIRSVHRTRWVSSGKKKFKVRELIITNY
jgi:DNA adenine methylase